MDHKNSLSRLKDHQGIRLAFQISRAISENAFGPELIFDNDSHIVQMGIDSLVLDLPDGFCAEGDQLKILIEAHSGDSSHHLEILSNVTQTDSDHIDSGRIHVKLALISYNAEIWRTITTTIEGKQKELSNIVIELKE